MTDYVEMKINKTGGYNLSINYIKNSNKNITISDKSLYGELCIELKSILEELYEDPRCKKYNNYKWFKENKEVYSEIIINKYNTEIIFSMKSKNLDINENMFIYCEIKWKDDNSIYEVLNNLYKILDFTEL